jgi:hypothetical protein
LDPQEMTSVASVIKRVFNVRLFMCCFLMYEVSKIQKYKLFNKAAARLFEQIFFFQVDHQFIQHSVDEHFTFGCTV